VSGWVRNLPDGRVEAVFEGDEGPVDAMVRWCHRGPSPAVVRRVDVEEENPTEEFSGFSVRY
jgi:acylphosphatase